MVIALPVDRLKSFFSVVTVSQAIGSVGPSVLEFPSEENRFQGGSVLPFLNGRKFKP